MWWKFHNTYAFINIPVIFETALWSEQTKCPEMKLKGLTIDLANEYLLSLVKGYISAMMKISEYICFHKYTRNFWMKRLKSLLPGEESNPGLPHDRQVYWPLYYRGCDLWNSITMTEDKMCRNKTNRIGHEPYEWILGVIGRSIFICYDENFRIHMFS